MSLSEERTDKQRANPMPTAAVAAHTAGVNGSTNAYILLPARFLKLTPTYVEVLKGAVWMYFACCAVAAPYEPSRNCVCGVMTKSARPTSSVSRVLVTVYSVNL